MKKHARTIASVLIASLITGCLSYSGLRSVNLYPQPEPEKVMAVIDGYDNEAPDVLENVLQGRIAQETLNHGMKGFFIYDKDTKESTKENSSKDSKGNDQVTRTTRYSVKLYAKMVADPSEASGNYIDAQEAYDSFVKADKDRGNVSIAATIVGTVVLVVVAIVAANEKK